MILGVELDQKDLSDTQHRLFRVSWNLEHCFRWSDHSFHDLSKSEKAWSSSWPRTNPWSGMILLTPEHQNINGIQTKLVPGPKETKLAFDMDLHISDQKSCACQKTNSAIMACHVCHVHLEFWILTKILWTRWI